MSQSGGLGIAIIEAASRLGVGLSSFVSVGNKADLSGNDFLQYWEQDPDTEARAAVPRVVRQPAEVRAHRPPGGGREADPGGQERPLGRRRARHLVAHRRDAVGLRRDRRCAVRAGGGDPHRHDARAVRRRRAAVGAAGPARRPGGDRHQRRAAPGSCAPTPARRTASRSSELPAAVRARLAEFLPAGAALGNPIDMIATASADDYRRTLQTLVDADACDAIIAIFVPPLVTTAATSPARSARSREANPEVPIAAVFMISGGRPAELQLGAGAGARLRVPRGGGAGGGAGRPPRPLARARRRRRCRGSRASDRSRPRRSSARSSRARTAGCRPRAWRSCSTATACR